jgi:hypothetical protein
MMGPFIFVHHVCLQRGFCCVVSHEFSIKPGDSAMWSNKISFGAVHHFNKQPIVTICILIVACFSVCINVELRHLVKLRIHCVATRMPFDVCQLNSWELHKSVLNFKEDIPVRNQYIQNELKYPTHFGYRGRLFQSMGSACVNSAILIRNRRMDSNPLPHDMIWVCSLELDPSLTRLVYPVLSVLSTQTLYFSHGGLIHQ